MARRRVAIWSANGDSFELSHPGLTGRNIFGCVATLTSAGESSVIELEMITPYRSMWCKFFRDLAANSEGWKGSKRWDSEFHELSIVATNGGKGTIDLCMSMRPSRADDEIRSVLRTSPEDIVRAADELPDFLRLPDELRGD